MKMWEKEGSDPEIQKQLFENWGNSFMVDEQNKPEQIKFDENNPYLDKDNKLALAK